MIIEHNFKKYNELSNQIQNSKKAKNKFLKYLILYIFLDEMRKEGEEKYKSAIVMFRFILIAVALPLAVANNLRTTPHAAAVTEAKATVVTNDHIHTMNVRLQI